MHAVFVGTVEKEWKNDMSIKTILFDMDGTLLPMDQDLFINSYMKLMAEKLAPYGFAPKEIIDSTWQGCYDMLCNDGSMKNEARYWARMKDIFGERAEDLYPRLDEFYSVDFKQVSRYCGYTPKSAELIEKLKKSGYRLVLATNPVFPLTAVEARIEWAGLKSEDFDFVTTYENVSYCKPNPAYYKEIASILSLNPEECLMVGNDVEDDMVAKQIGMHVFLLTDCLINKNNADITPYAQGSFEELAAFIGV